ncbi:MAG: ribosome biogenesis GTPase Der [Thermaerobacter sp.]|nr:ribosome biogenesis GTPase Der [Thermaerobacter sp.]
MGLVALVGRPNVGKSALFNRLTETRRAIVEDYEGVTRDRLYEETEWNGVGLTVVDTGGIWVDDDASILTMTRRQTEIAIDEADVLVWVVDGISGPSAADEQVASLLRRAGKPVIVAVNKAESTIVQGVEFYRYGFGPPSLVSAVHGHGIGDLLDSIVNLMPAEAANPERVAESPRRIAIAGRPNVGKSSLVNALSGQERTLVTPIAGTTRDVVDTTLERDGRRYVLLDTAGLRRPDRIFEHLEEKTVQRTLQAIRQADVVLLMVAANEPITAQDQRIAGQVANAKKASLVLLNKADLVKGTTIALQQKLREEFKFLSYARIMPVSVQTGWHLPEIWPEVDRVYAAYTRRLPTHALNQTIQASVHLNPPPTRHGRGLRIYYATQVSVRPPHIIFFVNDPELSHFSYERYLENRLREAFGFEGSPIRLTFRARRRREGEDL